MKKLLMSLAFATLVVTASAQWDAGKILATGGINFSTTTPKTEVKIGDNTTTMDGPTTTDFGIDVTGGYFIADNIAVGLGIGLAGSTISQEVDTTESTISHNIFGIAPFARYYIPYSDQFSFFGQFAIGVGFGKSKNEYTSGSTTTTNESSINMMMVGVSPGFSYMMTERVALEMRYGFFGYSSYTMKDEEDNGNYEKEMDSTFGLNLDLNSLVFGISVLF
jgi:outer membrane immunogenic protein